MIQRISEQRIIWDGKARETGLIHTGYLIIHKEHDIVLLHEGHKATVVHYESLYPHQLDPLEDGGCPCCNRQLTGTTAFCPHCGQALTHNRMRMPIPNPLWTAAHKVTGKTLTGYPILIVADVEIAFLWESNGRSNAEEVEYNTLWPFQAPITGNRQCPNCSIKQELRNQFCPECGQALLWSD